MKNWFHRKSLSSVEAVRDFVDTIEFINVLLAKESAQRDATLESLRVSGRRTGPSAAGANH